MVVHSARQFLVDGHRYQSCRFERCRLVYAGGDLTLRETLGHRPERGSRPRLKTRPGPDLDDSSALRDLMDRP
jgi:hypothetical protein